MNATQDTRVKANCSYGGCERLVEAKGLCHTHYVQQRRGIPLKPVRIFGLDKRCSFDGCNRKHAAKDLCDGHLSQKSKGQELRPLMDYSGDPRKRFWTQVSKSESCWFWTGNLTQDGYGVWRCNAKVHRAHRYSYEISVGEIPDGMQIDHTCHNRSCVNPNHLRLATNKQNRENLIGASKHSRSGVRGVQERNGRYRAYLTHNKKRLNIGTYDTIEEANEAVTAKRIELFTHNNLDRI